jgi:hypothetical protein
LWSMALYPLVNSERLAALATFLSGSKIWGILSHMLQIR